jgi:hypothetical protein
VRDLTSEVATLTSGKNYILSFEATTCDAGWARLAYAYIDFNNSDVYDYPDELIGVQNVDNRVQPFRVEFPFTPPPFPRSVEGRTRMRVFVVESGATPNPCLSFSYGQVKEFSIDLKIPPPTPTPECCFPSTFWSISDLFNGPTVQTVFTYQWAEKQAYLQRSVAAGKPISSFLCLGSANRCWSYTTDLCTAFSFVFPAKECPGSASSKFAYRDTYELAPGVMLTQWTADNVTITTVPNGEWCVLNTWSPNLNFLKWNLSTPDASVFEVPPICSQLN